MRRLAIGALALALSIGGASRAESVYDTIVYLPNYVLPDYLLDYGWIFAPMGVAMVPGSAPSDFRILVKPNIMSLRQAAPYAARYAQEYCRSAGLSGAVRFTGSRPYALADLESRSFDGRCG